MEIFEGRSIIRFSHLFSTEEKCKKYLYEVKWKNGFLCSKCNHTHCWEGKCYTKVCKNCRHVESATSNTLFHKVRFGLRKALFILFEMSTTTKSCSSTVLAAKYDITQKTAWLFMSKVRKAMDQMVEQPLEGPSQVLKVIIGNAKESSTGRGPGKGKSVGFAVDICGHSGIKRGYAINLAAGKKNVTNDVEKIKMLSLFKQFNQKSSMSPTQIKRYVKSLKDWLSGIHHQVSAHYLQGYLNEFSFRFNHHNKKSQLFHLLVENMIASNPAPYKLLHKI